MFELSYKMYLEYVNAVAELSTSRDCGIVPQPEYALNETVSVGT